MSALSGALRYFGRIKNGSTPSSGEATYWNGDVLWATPEDLGKLVGDKISDTKRKVRQTAVEETNLSILPRGSVLISTRAPIGHMAINEEPMAFNQGCRGIIPGDNVVGQYLYYILKARARELNAIANGTTFVELPKDELAAVRIRLPPLDTQRRIAAFLDEKTARIDGLIAKKRALLERLAEKRQALITQAVTKGLNPHAPMKPSGIDWLGEIPEHWQVCALGHRYGVQLGRMLNAERSQGENLKPYLRVNDVQWDEVLTENLPQMDFPPAVQAKYRLLKGDLLVNEGGSYVGRSAIWRGPLEECYYQKALHRLRARDSNKDTAEFFYFLMETATKKEIFMAGGNQTTIDHLTAEQFKKYRFPFPPLEEQMGIWKAIRHRVQENSAVVERILKSIDLLTEYRSALITAAVTGQIAERL